MLLFTLYRTLLICCVSGATPPNVNAEHTGLWPVSFHDRTMKSFLVPGEDNVFSLVPGGFDKGPI